jgi:septal ring-binding cell division protein DamX
MTSALRVGLALGGIVLTAVVIFGLGVMEGTRVAERSLLVAAPPSALPTEPLRTLTPAPVAPAAPGAPDKLTFYDRLSGVAPAAPVAIPEGPPPTQVLTPSAPPASPEAPARQPEALTPAVTAPAAPGKAAAPAAAAGAKTAVPSTSDPAGQIRKLTGKGRFTVQVAAVSDRSAAAETAALIKRNGFDSVTVMASVKGKIWYRIRVGSYPNKQAATKAAALFHSAFGLNAIPAEN